MSKPSNCSETSSITPQCQYYVVRKKRLCRMTVRPGRQYCGEHEPRPKTDNGKDDLRIPCPNDPKHTCYASKLKKHLSICNARQQQQPDYIILNINGSTDTGDCPRLPLNKIPLKTISKVIDKVNILYDILDEFNDPGRTESSLRHLRQASRLLHIVENEGFVKPNTCFIELGAGKGHLSYYAWWAWCRDTNSNVLLIDRASLRHKRDNKLRDNCLKTNQSKINATDQNEPDDEWDESSIKYSNNVHRLRADLANLALERVPAVRASEAVVGYAKHLCGVATDYALRCITSTGVLDKVSGVALATCCHHRCERAACLASRPLQSLGIDAEDFNVLLGVVSWATCGDGRSRDARKRTPADSRTHARTQTRAEVTDVDGENYGTKNLNLSQERRELIGKRAKMLLDWGRVLYLKELGFDAQLVYYVPSTVSLENVCIVAKKIS
ncbi:tRNA:m(4)X modification enzyme TRM13 homolog isoform X2 [Vanessa atalanta]|uniref:tRNA:m(4)X modification enzyme TRM13 homolog isoform X2 n=1 Tax=Vanessa atalanta TaxID=42275 RepID=UPI001FCD2334|nr:tRNA:m(4)X modification enzyme TRM13 homolog isoform X2 [Vanessa atalanta]